MTLINKLVKTIKLDFKQKKLINIINLIFSMLLNIKDFKYKKLIKMVNLILQYN